LSSEARPKLVTLLSLGVLILATLHWVRFVIGLMLPGLPLTVPIWYIPLTGAIWGTLWLAVAVGLFRRSHWAAPAARWGAVAYAGWYWADRILFVRSDYGLRTRPASLVLTAAGLVAVWWILHRRDVRHYLRENSG
jgi:hypothetical protein